MPKTWDGRPSTQSMQVHEINKDVPGLGWIGQQRTHTTDNGNIYVIRDVWADASRSRLICCQYATRPDDITAAHVWNDCREGVNFGEILPLSVPGHNVIPLTPLNQHKDPDSNQ